MLETANSSSTQALALVTTVHNTVPLHTPMFMYAHAHMFTCLVIHSKEHTENMKAAKSHDRASSLPAQNWYKASSTDLPHADRTQGSCTSASHASGGQSFRSIGSNSCAAGSLSTTLWCTAIYSPCCRQKDAAQGAEGT